MPILARDPTPQGFAAALSRRVRRFRAYHSRIPTPGSVRTYFASVLRIGSDTGNRKEYRQVVICDHNPAWADQFADLSAGITASLRSVALRIEHVGSTAVSGLAAKPIIDMDVVLASSADLPQAIRLLAGLGYVHEGDLGVHGREAFRCPSREAQHHLYVLIEGAAELQRHIAFRDALRADAALRDEYARLKRSLAARHPGDHEAYTQGKSASIEAVIEAIWQPPKPGQRRRMRNI